MTSRTTDDRPRTRNSGVNVAAGRFRLQNKNCLAHRFVPPNVHRDKLKDSLILFELIINRAYLASVYYQLIKNMNSIRTYGVLLLVMGLVLQQAYAQGLKEATVKNLAADPEPQSNQYTLFRFASGEVVPLKNFDSDQWDLGFKGTTLIVNGGEGRKGRGGVYIGNGVFEEVARVPDGIEWAADESETKTAIPGGSGNGWYEYVFSSHEIKPLPNKILFIRTADGKYAKVEILSYYRDVEGETDSHGRYYTFRYVYQPNGTGSFKP